jgi:hypothetical protein
MFYILSPYIGISWDDSKNRKTGKDASNSRDANNSNDARDDGTGG